MAVAVSGGSVFDRTGILSVSNVQITVFQFVTGTEQQILEKVLQKERRFPDSFFEIAVIGSDQSIAEIAAVVLEQFVGNRETERPQIFDGKDRRGAGIALDPVYPKPRFSATKKAARTDCPCLPSTRCAAAGYGVSPETVRISFQETDCHVLPSLISLLLLSSRYSTVSAD